MPSVALLLEQHGNHGWLAVHLSRYACCSCSLVVRGQFLRAGEEVERMLMDTDSSSDGGAVVHLVVRRTAKLSWSVCGSSSFELTISASDPADLVKR